MHFFGYLPYSSRIVLCWVIMQFSSTLWQKPEIMHTSLVIHLGFSDWSFMRAFSLQMQLASLNNLMLGILFSGFLPNPHKVFFALRPQILLHDKITHNFLHL
jgi:hypothetical protein